MTSQQQGAHPALRPWFLDTILQKTSASLEKWLIPGLRQEKYKLSPNYIIAPESKEVLEKTGHRVKGHRSHPEVAPNGQSWTNLSNKMKWILLGYKS